MVGVDFDGDGEDESECSTSRAWACGCLTGRRTSGSSCTRRMPRTWPPPISTVTAGEDVIVDFPGYGLWVLYGNGTWSQFHPFDVTSMIIADLDGNGRSDVVVDFPGYGVWGYLNGTTWVADPCVRREAAGGGRSGWQRGAGPGDRFRRLVRRVGPSATARPGRNCTP